MTNGTHRSKGAPSGAPTGRAPSTLPPATLPNVYVEKGGLGSGRVTKRIPEHNSRSCEEAAAKALAAFAFEERLVGAAKAHESFAGILAEHALALEDVRDELRVGFRALMEAPGFRALMEAPTHAGFLRAIHLLDEQITYVRELGSVDTP